MNNSVLLTKHACLDAKNISTKVKELVFDALTENIPVAFYWMDCNGYFLGCNDAELKIHHLTSQADFIGKHSDDISHPSAWENSKKAINTKQILSIEETHTEPDGKEIHFLSVKCPLEDEKGNVAGLLGISIDITDRKKMEEELRTAKEKAEEANRAKTQFLSVASHEMRTPLSGILGMARLLKNDFISNELTSAEKEQFLDNIIDAGTYQLSIMNDILDFAKLEADKFDLSLAPTDLKALLEEVIAMQTATAKIKGIELLFNYAPTIPHNIMSDSRALRQIFVNLIGNAIKFTETGHVAITVKCLQHQHHLASLEIKIEDTGIGIPANKIDSIFEKFSQVADAYVRNTSRSGTGLGLSIVKKLIQQMGASIRVESEPGKGSAFFCVFEFSLQSTAIEEMPWARYSSDIKILVVDDTLRGEVIRQHLGTSNCEAARGEQALALFFNAQEMKKPYDIVLIDEQLHTIKPSELIHRIKQCSQYTMTILLVPDASQKEKDIAVSLGFFAALVKPVQPRAFQATLTALWEKWTEQLAEKRQKQPLKVLIVEDDKIIQIAHKHLLSNLGCTVELAENGEQALEMVENGYDLILLDIGLPKISGIDVLKIIRQRSDKISQTPIVVVTGFTSEEDKIIISTAGATDILPKPLELHQAQAIVNRYME
jgi:two-component system, sensor histidine kinase and response regulator